MSELQFKSEEEAIQYLADLSQERVVVAGAISNIGYSLAAKAGLIEEERAITYKLFSATEDNTKELNDEILDHKNIFIGYRKIGERSRDLLSSPESASLSDISDFLDDILFVLPDINEEKPNKFQKIINEIDLKNGTDIIETITNKSKKSIEKLSQYLGSLHPAIKGAYGIEDMEKSFGKILINKSLKPALKSLARDLRLASDKKNKKT